jgi:hypothetical protein
MKAKLMTTVSILCPNCEEGKSCVSHLFDRSWVNFGPWHCDECGTQYRGTINSPEDIDVEILNKPADKKLLTLLVLEPHDRPVYLVLKDKAYEGSADGKEYLYNEHTCPTNYASQIETIIDGDDYDPHGIFQYVGSAFVADNFDFDDDEQVKETVDKLLSDPSTRDTDNANNAGAGLRDDD